MNVCSFCGELAVFDHKLPCQCVLFHTDVIICTEPALLATLRCMLSCVGKKMILDWILFLYSNDIIIFLQVTEFLPACQSSLRAAVCGSQHVYLSVGVLFLLQILAITVICFGWLLYLVFCSRCTALSVVEFLLVHWMNRFCNDQVFWKLTMKMWHLLFNVV